ncbi:MAG: glycosyltransferase family 2 protein [Vicinamibacterales bacterium]
MPLPVDLSLVVCTRNRGKFLPATLRAYLAIEGSANWELVVVDNGSTDDTADQLRAFQQEFTRPLTIVGETTPGLGRARNRGWQVSRAPIVAFSDDDCYLADDYFSALLSCFTERQSIAFVGGRILLHDQRDHPITIQTRETPRELRPGDAVPAGLIQGANFAFRRSTLEAIHGFDERLGVGTPFPAEDIDAIARATAAGFTGVYDPRPVVYHHHRRRTFAEVEALAKTYDYGRGAYYAKCLMNPALRRIYGRAWLRAIRGQSLWVTGREVSAALRYLAGHST